jgi:hypothetical protein
MQPAVAPATVDLVGRRHAQLSQALWRACTCPPDDIRPFPAPESRGLRPARSHRELVRLTAAD